MGAPKGNKNGLGNKGNRDNPKVKIYDPLKHPKKAYELRLLGLTIEDIATNFDITVKTIYEWKAQYFEFCEAIARGGDDADAKVVKSLFKRATGFRHKDTLYHVVKVDKDYEEVQATPVMKYIPPDVAAAKHWLGNRRRRSAGPWYDRNEEKSDAAVQSVAAALSAADFTFVIKDPANAGAKITVDIGGVEPRKKAES